MKLWLARTDRSLLDQQNRPCHSISPDDVVYFTDWYSRDWLEQKISQLGRPQLVVCDVEASMAPQPVPQVFVPEMRGGIFRRHRPGMTSVVDLSNTQVQTLDCFNFSVNKKSHDRFILLKLVQWFGLTSYQYTWSGSGDVMDMAPILQEMQQLPQQPAWYTSEFLSHILSPISGIEPLWHNFSNDIGQWFDYESRYAGDTWAQWKPFKRALTENTAVSILCDSATNLEPNFTITERLLYYIAGLNFAIFAGNYGQAEQLERMGIDTFPDMINHDYQWRTTVLERMYYAIHDNLEILTDLDYAAQARARAMSRLLANRDYVAGPGIDQWISQQYQLLPPCMLPELTAFNQQA